MVRLTWVGQGGHKGRPYGGSQPLPLSQRARGSWRMVRLTWVGQGGHKGRPYGGSQPPPLSQRARGSWRMVRLTWVGQGGHKGRPYGGSQPPPLSQRARGSWRMVRLTWVGQGSHKGCPYGWHHRPFLSQRARGSWRMVRLTWVGQGRPLVAAPPGGGVRCCHGSMVEGCYAGWQGGECQQRVGGERFVQGSGWGRPFKHFRTVTYGPQCDFGPRHICGGASNRLTTGSGRGNEFHPENDRRLNRLQICFFKPDAPASRAVRSQYTTLPFRRAPYLH